MKKQAHSYTVGENINSYNLLGGLLVSTYKILNLHILLPSNSTAQNLSYKVSCQYTDVHWSTVYN